MVRHAYWIFILWMLPSLSQAEGTRAYQQIEFNQGWKLKQIEPCEALNDTLLASAFIADSQDPWLSVVKMPAMVSDCLVDLGRIEEPWLPGHAEKYQWIAEKDWLYAVTFRAEDSTAPARLIFKGLDTIVDVYLNGALLASHANMYLPLKVDVSDKLKKENQLVLHFHTIYEKVNNQNKPLSHVEIDSQRIRVRRSKQNYSKYLGPNPRFSRVGVYDKIVLEIHQGSRLDEVVVDASLNEALDEGCVKIHVKGFTKAKDVRIRAQLQDSNSKQVADVIQSVNIIGNAFSEQVSLKIDNPSLWWPRGYGEQPLYQVQLSLMTDDRCHQTIDRTVGFRRITMSSMLHFVVNDVPVRLWGGDWVTPRWDTAVWDSQRVDTLFHMARHANFNAFRVWGVVESPRDDFYELANQQGFLIWQDFTDLPLGSDKDTQRECRYEAELMIKRLKHHPSILLWCGGNEAAMWHHQEFNGQLKDRGPWAGLPAAEEVGRASQELDPRRPYFPSSPYYGQNPNDPREGSTHGYTNMWFVPGYDYLNFASEDTRIAAPPLHSVERFMAPEDIWPEDYSTIFTHDTIYPYPKTWLKYTSASSWKKTGPIEQFYDARNPAELVYRLGMAEALYYQDIIERQRRGRDARDLSGRRRCGGYLVWKFNDSWPQIYSAKVDFFLEPYHTYYTLKRAYAPILLSFDKDAYIYLWAVNDTPTRVSGKIKVQLLHLKRNEIRKQIEVDVSLEPGQSKVVVDLDKAGISTFRKEHIVYAQMTDANGQELAATHCLADIERNISFPKAKLDVKVQNGVLVLRSDKYAKSVMLTGDANGDEFGWFFENNYFDLMPNQKKTVRILGNHNSGTITIKAWYSPYETKITWKR